MYLHIIFARNVKVLKIQLQNNHLQKCPCSTFWNLWICFMTWERGRGIKCANGIKIANKLTLKRLFWNIYVDLVESQSALTRKRKAERGRTESEMWGCSIALLKKGIPPGDPPHRKWGLPPAVGRGKETLPPRASRWHIGLLMTLILAPQDPFQMLDGQNCKAIN